MTIEIPLWIITVAKCFGAAFLTILVVAGLALWWFVKHFKFDG